MFMKTGSGILTACLFLLRRQGNAYMFFVLCRYSMGLTDWVRRNTWEK